MTKSYTPEDFSTRLTEDRVWRIRELSDLKHVITKTDSTFRRPLLRAAVTLCYAHWEGHVKYSASQYLSYVALRKMKFCELDRQFIRNFFYKRLAAMSQQKRNMQDYNSIIDDILDCVDNRYSKSSVETADTRSNLNYNVLCDLCIVCSIDHSNFSTDENFIDVILLKRRNSIAHGENEYILYTDLESLTDRTISIMRKFSDAIDNNVSLERYKSSTLVYAPA